MRSHPQAEPQSVRTTPATGPSSSIQKSWSIASERARCTPPPLQVSRLPQPRFRVGQADALAGAPSPEPDTRGPSPALHPSPCVIPGSTPSAILVDPSSLRRARRWRGRGSANVAGVRGSQRAPTSSLRDYGRPPPTGIPWGSSDSVAKQCSPYWGNSRGSSRMVAPRPRAHSCASRTTALLATRNARW